MKTQLMKHHLKKKVTDEEVELREVLTCQNFHKSVAGFKRVYALIYLAHCLTH